MRNQINLKARISLYGPDWLAIKEWLQIEREHLVSKIIAGKDQDETNKLRGAIELIDKLLFVEKDAEIAAASNQGTR